MKHRDIRLLKKIISECKDIIRYSNEIGKKGFLENDVYQKATAMSLLNIGEHANVLSRELWMEYKDIQWRKIVDLRNIVAHGYGELRMELVWNLSQKEVPLLLEQLEDLLNEV
ncbi:HepT-like ribonuclease domain-containing protein [Desulfosporosinus shakirovi]|uniref:HepT-like ribonuclease domain-containing protein n=1 Tax=Desulfosporosinus shakirovi TaxID=2885154 RepID=UPI001E3AB4D6|nr:HepT-like ribonuclease domain-containing protein [Desulfosporosinus sp. SRJS8]MCB8815442.1 DUF86 domain-containing protein [Desulfosporosinus sp. SRJS8]